MLVTPETLATRIADRIVAIAAETHPVIIHLVTAPDAFDGVERRHSFVLSDGRRLDLTIALDWVRKAGTFTFDAPVGKLNGQPPYAAWEIRADRRPGGPWGIRCAGGYNCFGDGGAIWLSSREEAEAVIRSHGHEPAEAVHG